METEELAEWARAVPPVLFYLSRGPSPAAVGPWVCSQWYPATFATEGQRFRTAEHYMMWSKALAFGDYDTAELVLASDHPRAAKALGRRVANLHEPTWEALRFDVVVRANLAKFAQHETLRAWLISTAPALLVEASPSDRVWGIGLDEADPDARRPERWRGQNLLGLALCRVRDLLTAASTPQENWPTGSGGGPPDVKGDYGQEAEGGAGT